MDKAPPHRNDTKKVFMKKGSCSQALCFIVNRELGHNLAAAEKAADPFAGGLLLQGHQCGMVWGAALAAGIQAWKASGDTDQATATAMSAAADLVKAFAAKNGSANCREVCGHDFTKKLDLFAFMVKFLLHLNRECLNVAAKWAPEACATVREALPRPTHTSRRPRSCASLVAKKLGATDEEAVTVAGLAGGIGFSGNACGALGAAVWMRSLAYQKDHPGKSAYNNAYAKKALKRFQAATGGKMLCRDLCGRHFGSIDEHTEFIEAGGCSDVIEILGSESRPAGCGRGP